MSLGAGRVVLAIAVAVSIAASILIYGQQTATINSLSSELAEKSLQVEQQKTTIDEYTSQVASQQVELETKNAQLDELQSEIGALVREIGSQESQLAEKSAQVEELQADLAQLQSQTVSLEQDIASLRSEIQAKDADLAGLILENASARRVHVTYFGLGVDERGDGIVFPMELEIIGSGAGRISVDVSNVDYQTGFQEAVRTAAAVAEDYTGIAVSDKDIIIRLVNDSDGLITVDGPSAGAAMTAMMIAGLTDRQPDSSVLVTGTIGLDGRIGRVGGLDGKADAANAFGADKLLVPRAQQFQDSRIQVVGVSDVEDLVRHIITGTGGA